MSANSVELYKLHREIQDLRRQNDLLARQMERRPVRWPTTTQSLFIDIDGGNILSDGSTNGIYYASVTTVPSLYDPTVTSSGYINGMGRGTLYVNGISQGFVLVVNNGSQSSLINQALFHTDRVSALFTISIPLAGDATQSVQAYPPYSL